MTLRVPAVVAAGDQGAAKAIYGRSKVYLEIGDRSLVAHVVAALQRVPEVSEIWVVGDAPRLRAVLDDEKLREGSPKPLHVVSQFRSLLENSWETYRRLLPGAGPEGRDPTPSDAGLRVLYLSGDLPFATPQEISAFIQRSAALDCDYALGLVNECSMRAFYPQEDRPGIRMAYFNIREGRFRQSNLHLVDPGAIGNRHYIEEMYENRHQRELGRILRLAWRLLVSEQGGFALLFYFLLLQLGSFAERHGWQRLATRLASWIPIARVEKACSELLRTRFRFVVTEVGGCAVDIDTEEHYDVAKRLFDVWIREQRETAERLHGRPALPPPTGDAGATEEDRER